MMFLFFPILLSPIKILFLHLFLCTHNLIFSQLVVLLSYYILSHFQRFTAESNIHFNIWNCFLLLIGNVTSHWLFCKLNQVILVFNQILVLLILTLLIHHFYELMMVWSFPYSVLCNEVMLLVTSSTIVLTLNTLIRIRFVSHRSLKIYVTAYINWRIYYLNIFLLE